MKQPLYSLIIPVYKNEKNIPALLERVQELYVQVNHKLEAVFVVDCSPDRSYELLQRDLPSCDFPSQIMILSRNCGSPTAFRTGLAVAKGKYFAAMSADLQEPAELIQQFFQAMDKGDCDIAVGKRTGRDDPFCSKWSANFFWLIYKKLVQPDMPSGGIDSVCFNEKVRDAILALKESNTSLPGQLIWLGFRRKEIPYKRKARKIGKSSWTFLRKVRYMLDSIFSFTDLPITCIIVLGCLGLLVSMALALNALAAWYLGNTIPGYTTLILLLLFLFSLVLISLGIIGNYIWRAYENTKNRPMYILMQQESFPGKAPTEQTLKQNP